MLLGLSLQLNERSEEESVMDMNHMNHRSDDSSVTRCVVCQATGRASSTTAWGMITALPLYLELVEHKSEALFLSIYSSDDLVDSLNLLVNDLWIKVRSGAFTGPLQEIILQLPRR